MNDRIWVLTGFGLALVLAGCSDGLTTSLESADGAVPANADDLPTLGPYGKPCEVIGNSQWPLASFSPAGDTVALTAGGPGHIELHATNDGHLVTGFDAHLGLVTDIAFSPKDDLLATSGVDGTVKLWRSGSLVAERQVFSGTIAQLVWSHDAASLVLVEQTGPLALLHVTGTDLTLGWSLARQRRGHPFFSADDSQVTVSDGSGQETFAVADGRSAADPLGFGFFRAQSPDATVIAYEDSPVFHVRMVRQDVLLWERGFPYQPTGIAFTADSKSVAIWGGSTGDPVSLYDASNGNLVASLPWAANSAVRITFSPDGRSALVFDSYDAGAAARLVNLSSGDSLTLASQPPRSDSIGASVSVSADGVIMVSPTWLSGNSFDTALQIWNLSTRQRVSQVVWAFSYPWAPTLSARGELIYGFELTPAGSNQATRAALRFESLVDPALSSRWPIDARTQAVALASDGLTLALVDFEYDSDLQWTIRVVDRLSSVTKSKFSIGSRPTINAVFSADGTQIGVVRSEMFPANGGTNPSDTRDFSVWRVADGQLLFDGRSHTHAPRQMAFSPDGNTAVLIGDGGADYAGVEVYDARHWKWSRTLDQSLMARQSAHFSVDGTHLVVAQQDGLRVWRTSDWQSYDTFGTDSSDAVFMPGGQVLEIRTGIVWCRLP